jgi:hypothetical protein
LQYCEDRFVGEPSCSDDKAPTHEFSGEWLMSNFVDKYRWTVHACIHLPVMHASRIITHSASLGQSWCMFKPTLTPHTLICFMYALNSFNLYTRRIIHS